ncbi:MAG: MFS transporter [Pseudomonadota bacterium]
MGWGVTPKLRSITLLVLAQVSALSLWFISSAVLPDMLVEFEISPLAQAALTSAVAAGFVLGALISAFTGLSDRFDPRFVFATCACIASGSGFGLLLVDPGTVASITLRFVTGMMLAGVYPVGMKIAVGWGKEDRGLLVGVLVGALTFGSASPHLVAWLGEAEWRLTIAIVSSCTLISAGLILLSGLGPFHAKAPAFEASSIKKAWTIKRVRYAYLGYFGHMWELYAMWAWIGTATLASYKVSMPEADAVSLSKLTAFLAIGLGGVACILGGMVADKLGKAEVTIVAMIVSGLSALLAAVTFGGDPWITFVVVIVWGIAIIPDSPQFSALVADGSPPEIAGSLMTFQTAIGFALTILTVQLTPYLVSVTSWPTAMVIMALGPAFGVWYMLKLRALTSP